MSVIPKESDAKEAARAQRAAYMEERILDAAESVFARRGLAGSRVREIADAAGVNGATLYNYYPSKDALYEAVLDRGMRPLSEALAAFAEGSRERESIDQVARSIMQHLAEHPQLSRLIYLETIAQGPHLRRLADRWFRPLLGQILGELEASPATEAWPRELLPAFASLFIHLAFGHFALAPLLQEVFGGEPLSEAGVAAQTQLIEGLVHQIFPHIDP
ncbi:MAG: TetR family transcriptional regulator, partial [Deltaproteobacteria bacterium]|nr:TetR family transcriptional regulator [Deltaproteobacteria bacterium]